MRSLTSNRRLSGRLIFLSSRSWGHLITDYLFNSLKVGNALAFDAHHLSAVTTTDVLMKVTHSVIIHGFEFADALDFCIKECTTLGRHTAVLHFADKITKYSWAHHDYQPWGHALPLQCPQCGILKPWVQVYVPQVPAYRMECRNESCGIRDGKRKGEKFSLQISRPSNSVMLSVGKQHGGSASGWLKVVIS